jgi:phosphohistidine phosphatase SixA
MAIILVRHGSAGKRGSWSGDDRLRPLDARGRKQAQGIASALADRGVDRILSSPYARCIQTVEPLADALDLEVEERPELAESAGASAASALAEELADRNAVLCTHGDVVEDLLGEPMKKGAAYVLERTQNGLEPVGYLPPAA